MTTLLILILGTVLIQNSATVAGAQRARIIHARGAFAREFDDAWRNLFTLTLACVAGYLMQRYGLAPRELSYLRTPLLLISVALIFAAARRLVARSSDAAQWPDFLAYATHHAALFGLALFGAFNVHSIGGALAYGIGAAFAMTLLNAIFVALRERVVEQEVPFVFRGIPIALITAGLMALALFGFVGLVRQ